jgi:lipid-A-disaccharide synthase
LVVWFIPPVLAGTRHVLSLPQEMIPNSPHHNRSPALLKVTHATSILYYINNTMTMNNNKTVMFVAGDPSGDIHAAPVIRELHAINQGLECWGIGGPQMVEQGFRQLMPFEPFNKMGFIEVIKHLGFFLDAKKKLIKEMHDRKPSCLVCVDYPGLNMPLMKAAKKLGIPVVWYIAPMVWAWKKKRARVLGACADFIGCIFPFEPSHFLPYTDKVAFIGNPTVQSKEIENKCGAESDTWNGDGKDSKQELSIALVPGSRLQEISRMLRPMLDAFMILKKEFPELRAEVSVFKSINIREFDIIKEYPGVTATSDPLGSILSRVSCAIVKSGTSTLETALACVPMVIAYKTSTLTYELAKRLVKLSWIGLPNIIAQASIVPECIQDSMNAEMLAHECRKFLVDKSYYRQTVDALQKIRGVLGAKKPSVELAGKIAEIIKLSG